MDLTIRTLTDADFEAFASVDDAAFSVHSDKAHLAQSKATIEWDRMVGAFADGVLCGAAGVFSMDLTVPGGREVAVGGVTAVGVLPTHRRRGVLSALMSRVTDDIAARGEPIAVLTASEATIYRRFGYGVATRVQRAKVARGRSAFGAPVDPAVRLRLVDDDEARALAPGVFDAHRRRCAGGLSRPVTWWPYLFGQVETWQGGGEHFTVVGHDAAGQVAGYALYRVKRDAPAGHWTLVVLEVVAVDDAVEAALWRYLLDVDLVEWVEVEALARDDPLRWRLRDPRALAVNREVDFLWARIIDPAGALSARAWARDGDLVLDLVDGSRAGNTGRWLLSVRGGSAQVERLGGSGSGSGGAVVAGGAAEVAMDIADLGSLFLGDVAPSVLAGAGRLRPVGGSDSVALADRMFATSRAPFSFVRF